MIFSNSVNESYRILIITFKLLLRASSIISTREKYSDEMNMNSKKKRKSENKKKRWWSCEGEVSKEHAEKAEKVEGEKDEDENGDVDELT